MPEKPDPYIDDYCNLFGHSFILEAIKDADVMQEYDELMEKWRF